MSTHTSTLTARGSGPVKQNRRCCAAAIGAASCEPVPDRTRSRAASRGGALALCLLGLSTTGCGHPASRPECEEIFSRSAEIELRSQDITDPATIAERTAAAREAKGEVIIDSCVGKRITDSAMACVRAAKSGDEMDECLQ